MPEATRDDDLWKVVLVSWCIAFFEYCFQVPANRLGHGQFSAAELKTIQEIITSSSSASSPSSICTRGSGGTMSSGSC